MYDNAIKSWLYPCAPRSIDRTTSGTSGTYQASSSEYEALHVITSTYDLLIAEGDGSSVDASSGLFWPASTPYYFMPVSDQDAIGFQSLDGSSFSSTNPCTVAVVERKR